MVVRRCVSAAVAVAFLVALAPAVMADDPLSIREIQSNTQDGDASVYDYAVYGDLVDCAGGVVVASLSRTVPRLILQDPNDPNGWGGIQVKDRFNVGAFDEVEVGDWVSLTNMQVEEFRGTTFLQWYETNNPGLAIESHANALPQPIEVAVGNIPAPVYEPNDPNGWYVENHDAEPYESMRLRVCDVTVTMMGLGKDSDNYNLQGPGGADCWAADYLNVDKAPWDDYHAFVAIDREFCAVTGIFEQYTNLSDGYDYYQLITLSSADLTFCGDVDHDGDTDLADLAQLLGNYGTTSDACYEDGDLDYDGDVDLSDLAEMLGHYGTIWI
jgi:hypothetical protein